MFTPVQLDLTDYLAEKNELFVKIFPVPKKQPGPVGHRQAAASVNRQSVTAGTGIPG